MLSGSLDVVADPVEVAELVLHVVAVLMCDHVGLRERRRPDSEAGLELVEEAEVDVDELVARAVERADLRARQAAAGLHPVGEEDRVHERVAPAAPLEDAVPELLHAVDHGDDPAVLPPIRILAGTARLRDLARRVALADGLVVERGKLAQAPAAGEERDQQVDDDAGKAEAAAADREPATHAAAADVRHLAGVETRSSTKPHP